MSSDKIVPFEVHLCKCMFYRSCCVDNWRNKCVDIEHYIIMSTDTKHLWRKSKSAPFHCGIISIRCGSFIRKGRFVGWLAMKERQASNEIFGQDCRYSDSSFTSSLSWLKHASVNRWQPVKSSSIRFCRVGESSAHRVAIPASVIWEQ